MNQSIIISHFNHHNILYFYLSINAESKCYFVTLNVNVKLIKCHLNTQFNLKKVFYQVTLGT